MGMIDASAPNPSGVVLWNPSIWDILLFILIKNHVVCVPSTIAKWISFRNHKNKTVVRGNHNVLALYVDASAPGPSGVVLCNPFKWDILLSILLENHVVCVPSTSAKYISFSNHKSRKVVVLSCATLSNEMFCCSFLIKILFFVFVHQQQNDFFPQPQEQKSCRRHTKCSSTLCGC